MSEWLPFRALSLLKYGPPPPLPPRQMSYFENRASRSSESAILFMCTVSVVNSSNSELPVGGGGPGSVVSTLMARFQSKPSLRITSPSMGRPRSRRTNHQARASDIGGSPQPRLLGVCPAYRIWGAYVVYPSCVKAATAGAAPAVTRLGGTKCKRRHTPRWVKCTI